MAITTVDSPSDLAGALTALFPAFADELDDHEIATYHQVLQLLAPRVAAFLHSSSERATKSFAGLLNAMVSKGGDQENAVSTCLLEHASQIGIRKLIRPHLTREARSQLW